MFMQAAGVFSNARVRRHGRAYVLGLLSQAERKNSWRSAGCAPTRPAALVLRARWQRLSCADGSNGPRLYDWALIGTAEGPGHHLLVRRSLVPGEEGQLEPVFFRSWSRRPVTLPEVAAVARARWGVEDCFAEAKGEAGLDTTRSASTGPGTGTSPWPCSRTRSLPPPPAPPGPPSARPPSLKGGPDTCGQRFASPRTYAPPAFVYHETGRDLIPSPPPRHAASSTSTRTLPVPSHSTGNGQTGDDAARPSPANPATPEDSEITGRRCSTSRPAGVMWRR